MSFEDWKTATLPKIQGSWNLHELLPKDMDFFVLLSSTTGIGGNPGQCNYAAGNTYQDSLASYRRKLGLPGVSIDLGIVKNVGFVAENPDKVDNSIKEVSYLEILEEELHLLISSTITGYTNNESRMPPQLITGLGTGGLLEEHGTTIWWLNDSKFSYLQKLDTQAASGSNDDNECELRNFFATIESLADASKAITEALAIKLAKAMMINVEDISVDKPIHSYGGKDYQLDQLELLDFKGLIVNS
jgi:KR domain